MECIPGRFENYEIEFSRMCAMEIDNRQCKKHTMGSWILSIIKMAFSYASKNRAKLDPSVWGISYYLTTCTSSKEIHNSIQKNSTSKKGCIYYIDCLQWPPHS